MRFDHGLRADQQLPLFSIVVPSFNQGRFLDRCLRSIFAQRYPRLEVVVMDGGSSDDSVQIIQSYADRLRYWQSEPDDGQAAAINAGMQHCHGDQVAWLNSDDWYCEGALWTVARAVIAHPTHGLSIGNGFRYDQATQRFTAFCPRHIALNRAALIEGVDYILQPATFFARTAWLEASGLDPQLHYGLDWDLLIRVAQRHAAVLINEFLAVSREYAGTKTSRGDLARVEELTRIAARYSGRRATAGSLYYRIHTLLCDDGRERSARADLQTALATVGDYLADLSGNRDGFPERSDAQDRTYLPRVHRGDVLRRPSTDPNAVPAISVITPSLNQAPYLSDALDSVIEQQYPHLELIVCDGGSTDGSIAILERYADRLTHCVSEPDRGPAHAINTGLARARGEIVSWLSADDMLAADALWEVGAAFAADPELDLVYANALYVDEHNELTLADHGFHRTGLYRGAMQSRDGVAPYWSYVDAVPQPTVFFRRRLLERCGMLDESHRSIFDFELFWRLRRAAKAKKLERTLAFCRVRAQSNSSDRHRLAALYRCSRPSWPPLLSPAFVDTLREFLYRYMHTRYGDRPRDGWFWTAATVVALSAVTRIGNPEALHLSLPTARRSKSSQRRPTLDELSATVSRVVPTVREGEAPAEPAKNRLSRSMRILVLTRDFPFFPGGHGGNARTFSLLRGLAPKHRFTVVTSAHTAAHREAIQHLEPLLERLECDPIPFGASDMGGRGSRRAERGPANTTRVGSAGASPSQERALLRQAMERFRRDPAGALGRTARYAIARASLMPRDAALAEITFANLQTPLQRALANGPYDILQIECSDNAGWRRRIPFRGPSVLVVQDVKTIAWWRRSASARRLVDRARALAHTAQFAWYERRHLRRFDALVAMSEADRAHLQRLTHHPHIAVVPNGVDIEYFRPAVTPADEHRIVFTATLNHPPNHDGILYFVQEIWPRVQQHEPDARLDIVGADPPADVWALADDRIRVTGFVADVRPYITAATVVVCPLRFASGTRLKILEAMAMGKAVVATRIGAEGLDVVSGTDLCIADTPDEFADRVSELLHDPALRARMGAAARVTATRYDWTHSAARLEAVYSDVRQRWNAARHGRRSRVGFNGLFVVPGGATGGLAAYMSELIRHVLHVDGNTAYVLFGRRANLAELASLHGENLQRHVVRSARSVARMDVDFVHSFPGYIDAAASAFPNVLTVADLQHEYHPEFFPADELAMRQALYPRSAQRALNLIAISAFTRRCLIERYAVAPEKIVVIPLGVPARFFAPDPDRIRNICTRFHLPDAYCIYPANPWPHKNHLRLLDALTRIPAARRPHLVLTGAIPRVHIDLRDAVQSRGLDAYIHWLGFVDDEEMPALFARARMLVFPSLFEGFGMPVLEAMAAGCPVACSNATALPETAADAADYFDPSDVDAVAGAIDALWHDDDRRRALIAAGRARAREFTWLRTALQTVKLYREVAAGL